MNTEIIPRTTLTILVSAWRESEAEIRQAFGLLVSAEKRLKETFKPDSYLFDLSRTDNRYRRYEDPDELLKELKKDVWRVLIDRMELRRILSVKRNEELNRQIETGKDLPDIDEAQILAMLEGTLANTSMRTKAVSAAAPLAEAVERTIAHPQRPTETMTATKKTTCPHGLLLMGPDTPQAYARRDRSATLFAVSSRFPSIVEPQCNSMQKGRRSCGHRMFERQGMPQNWLPSSDWVHRCPTKSPFQQPSRCPACEHPRRVLRGILSPPR